MADLPQIVHVEPGVRYALDTDDTISISVMVFRHRGAGEPRVLCGPTAADTCRLEAAVEPVFSAEQARRVGEALIKAASLAELWAVA